MSNRVVPIREAIKFGWENAKKNIIFFLKVFGVLLLVGLIPQALNYLWEDQPMFLIVLLVIISAVIRLITDLGLLKISLDLADSKKPELSTLFSYTNWRTLLKFFLAGLLYNLVVGVGIILLIIPGIYFAIRFQYFGYLVVDKNLGPIEAFKESSRLTLGVKMGLLKFGALLGLINILGFLALIVGLIWTVPTAMVANAYMFRKLQKETVSS